jgi:TusA-related sulfurtransferase
MDMETVSVLGSEQDEKVHSLGEYFIASLAERDSEKLISCLDRDVRFRALVPSGFKSCKGSAEAVTTLQSWFKEAEQIELLQKAVDSVSQRLHVSYRFRESYADGETEIIEQHAFCDVKNALIESIDIVCSGHLPERKSEKVSSAKTYRFDAGDLGCGSGLPQEFRSQINSIPIGQILEVVTKDPSAKEDLPSLARLLGHEVISVKMSSEGKIVLTVRREH